MQLTKPSSGLFIPDGSPAETALARTTHLAIGAHADDIEIMAMHGILAGFASPDRWFTAALVTDGSGSPRDGAYRTYTNEQMQAVRRREQDKAAVVGEYSAVAYLDFTSAEVKDPACGATVADLRGLLLATRPKVVYVHNPADKHATHVAVCLRTLAALRSLPAEARPGRVLGCEVWRDLDWLSAADKVVLDVSEHDNIAAALVALFDSQVAGGKRYDHATMGRRRAHATYLESHGVDQAEFVSYAMDLTPLVADPAMDVRDFVGALMGRFAAEVGSNLSSLGGAA